MSELLALGVSHKTAPVALRERVALPDARAQEFLGTLVGDAEVHEAVAISTCNRTEVYLVVGDAVEAETTVLGMLARQAGIRPTELAEAIYAVRNCDAARHLFRVTAGLESMIIGEAEVQGQVKRAYELALGAGVTGPLTNRMFGAALATGKRVRSETALSQRRVSVPSVAVDLAQETLGALGERRVVVLGTGEMAELTARALADRGVHTVFIANRRRERALALAEQFGGRVAPLDGLVLELSAADIVLASTASPHPIVGSDELSVVMQERGGRALLLIDIAVPRDVDPLCRELPGVTLYDVDDLQAVVARNLQVRQAEAQAADGIVEEEIKRFAGWLGSLEVLPTISALRAHGEDIVASVLSENEARFEERDRERLRALARSVMQRLLHEPTLRMKGGGDGRTHARMQLVRELFGLEDAEEEATAADAEPADVHELPAPRSARRPR
ncbi:MAG: glutamyl-tRNA reductase [Actinomycetota bacterium]|nr:glutamyl-tRNA reductase [Actinomycetota bacterium]